MEKENKNLYLDIPKEKFQFANSDRIIHDKELETKPIGFFKDAMIRFKKNKSSVVAAFIIMFLFIYAIFVPFIFKTKYNTSQGDTLYLEYQKLLPKTKAFAWLGWDGTKTDIIDNINFVKKQALAIEQGITVVSDWERIETEEGISYKCKIDSYTSLGMKTMTLTKDQYKDIMDWQIEHGVQVIYPYVDYNTLTKDLNAAMKSKVMSNPDIWYKVNKKGQPIYTVDQDGNVTLQNCYKLSDGRDNYYSLRTQYEIDNNVEYQYAIFSGKATYDENGMLMYDEDGFIVGDIGYVCRVSKYFYFEYVYGFEPSFVFGTNAYGQDIFYRLAQGARFSFVLAICVSLINLTVGAIYGAIEGYYGRGIDLAMERFVEILGGIPFIVVTTLFQLHLAKYVGVVGALLFAFFTTGWIGMAGTVRMQFYRFKNQEYILAARTLGAKDFRIMFKHIFPNALGTIITSCVMVIPGVIFSESSLTYLGIINLESSRWTSVGTMLALGKDYLSSFPHIILFPALFISLLEISFNLFGNGLRDAFNPSLRGSEG
ncbi:MAG: ABC transporter permease [Bacilli bacterium]|nr:ABC transporter permease [Bacilli bacterium]